MDSAVAMTRRPLWRYLLVATAAVAVVGLFTLSVAVTGFLEAVVLLTWAQGRATIKVDSERLVLRLGGVSRCLRLCTLDSCRYVLVRPLGRGGAQFRMLRLSAGEETLFVPAASWGPGRVEVFATLRAALYEQDAEIDARTRAVLDRLASPTH